MASIIMICVLFVQAIFLATVIVTKKSSKRKTPPLPPGRKGWPIIGNTLEMLRNRPTFRWIHRQMKEMNTEIACFHFGISFHIIPVTCNEIAREMLKEKESLFTSRVQSFGAEFTSEGYKNVTYTPYNDQWKKMRRIIVSDLNCQRVFDWLHDRRSEESDNLMAYVRALSEDSKLVNIRDVTRHYCQSLTMRIMFNKRYFGQAAPNGGPGADDLEHLEAIFTCLANVNSYCISDYLPYLKGFNLDGKVKLVRQANYTMDRLQEPIIDERIRKWRNVDGGSEQVQDWLDILVTLKDADGKSLLTREEIKALTKDIMLGAVDNPSNNVEWMLAEMLNQPEILKKAIEELDRVVGKERLVQESDIPNLNYIKACSKETFRMHPVLAFNSPRVALSDTTLGGYFIPKGSHVCISRIALGRNPKTWDDPHTFNPERHIIAGVDEEVSLVEPDLRFISFSTGRRGCMAMRLGTCMTTLLLARLVQGFTWSLPDPGRMDLSESSHDMFLAKPLTVRAKPRLSLHLYPKVK